MLRTTACLLLASALFAQDVAKIELPRVLLLGDTSLNNQFQNTQKALRGKAQVVRSPLGHLSSGAVLARVGELQQQRWDIICLNFGLNDLMSRDPGSKRIRAMSPQAGGVPVTSLEDHGKNLTAIVNKLRKSSNRLIWLTTMPLHPRQNSGAIAAADIARYNKVATQRMQALGVDTLDLHTHIEEALAAAKNQRARNHQHNQLFKQDLSAPVVKAILAIPTETTHRAGKHAHCDRCKTVWGAKDLRSCKLHRLAGVAMDPRCRYCRYHGAYKFIFAKGVAAEEQERLRRGKEPATKLVSDPGRK